MITDDPKDGDVIVEEGIATRLFFSFIDQVTRHINNALTVEILDEGSSLTPSVNKMNFVGGGVTVTEPATDEILVTIDTGGGNISNTGTPVNDQIAVWTDATTVEGTTGLRKTATQFIAGNYLFNTDETVGAGQDNFVLTYDDGSGEIGLEVATGGGSGDVTKVGTPIDNQIGVWTGDGTIEGDSGLTKTATQFTAENYTFNIDETVGSGQDNFVLTYDNATGEIGLEASVGGSGAWELISTTVPTAVNAIDLTFDETTYSEIKLVADGLTVDTDSIHCQIRLGSGDGSTIYSGAADYNYSFTNLIAPAWANFNAQSEVLITTSSIGNAAGEEFQFTLELNNFLSANAGGTFDAFAMWTATSGATITQKTHGALEGVESAIDTIQIRLESTAVFGTTGTIKMYGLNTTGGGGGGASSIDDLTDVDTTTDAPNIGDSLLFDGTNWVTNLTQLIKEVDDVSGTTIYIGDAQPGTTTATASWRVKRIVFTGDDSETLFADGDVLFNNTWDGRAGFSYS